jgi:hypothetical protein
MSLIKRFFLSLSVPKEVESTRKSSGGGEIVTETTLYQETHNKGGVQRYTSSFGSKGKCVHTLAFYRMSTK